jgi:hypothetical protein
MTARRLKIRSYATDSKRNHPGSTERSSVPCAQAPHHARGCATDSKSSDARSTERSSVPSRVGCAREACPPAWATANTAGPGSTRQRLCRTGKGLRPDVQDGATDPITRQC